MPTRGHRAFPMPTTIKIALLLLGGLFVLAAVAAAWFAFVGADVLKPRAESALSEALDMNVEIRGNLRLRVRPAPQIMLNDVHVRDRQTEVASAERVGLEISAIAWWRDEFPVRRLWLDRPRIRVERTEDGTFPFERPDDDDRETPRALTLERVSMTDASLLYRNSAQGGFEAVDCDAKLDHFTVEHGGDEALVRRLSLDAQVVCSEIRQQAFTIHDLQIPITASNGRFELQPISLRVFGGQGSARARADLTRAAPRYRLDFQLSEFRIEEYLKILSPRSTAAGSMSFSSKLSSWGTTAEEIRRNTSGHLSLNGEDLTLYGVDLDEEISDYESTQAFDLVDLSAFFLAGPLGVAVSKGYDFAGIAGGSGESTDIHVLGSEWRVENGKVRAQDVAMTTAENRIALLGSVDFTTERYQDVAVAVVDERGCPMVVQEIRGSFEDPEVQSPNILTTLTAPAMELLQPVKRLFGGSECEDAFYAGSVPPPGNDK